jgi:LAGLIDADG DNA endonuclease family protein
MPPLDKLAAFASQPSVPPVYVQSGNTPWAQRYSQELRDVVTRYAARLPRNVQRHLGPSELGHRCDRQLVGKMAGVSFGPGAGNMLHDPWASIVGTAIHAFLDDAFKWESRRNGDRWVSEARVTPDPGAASPHPGTADLYDKATRTLADHKGVALDTRIPTPTGWTTMWELRTGDEVLGADGRPCKVTRTYPVQYRSCYRVKFKGGAEVVTDDVQLWEVQRNKNGGQNSDSQETVLLSSAEMRAQLRAANGQRHLRVRAVAVELPEADLPINPYVLGCWLGDGEKSSNVILSETEELFRSIRVCGYETGDNLDKRGYYRRTILGIRPKLRALGVLGSKHIPAQYMRASHSQRLELLRGLMDTDGSHNKQRNQCVFTSTDKALAYQVEELAASLGWKSYTCSFQANGFGLTATAYQVMFTPVGAIPFHLERKRALVQQKRIAGAGYRIVQSVEPVECVPTKCIDVDSDDHLYLVTEQFIPTHNCQSESIRARLRKDGPPYHYYIQMLLYAVGYMHLGFDVRRVALVSWPRTKSTLDDMYVWEKQVAIEDIREVAGVLDRTVIRERLAGYVAQGALSFWDVPPTPGYDDCTYCPFYNPAALQDRTSKGCPGTSLK